MKRIIPLLVYCWFMSCATISWAQVNKSIQSSKSFYKINNTIPAVQKDSMLIKKNAEGVVLPKNTSPSGSQRWGVKAGSKSPATNKGSYMYLNLLNLPNLEYVNKTPSAKKHENTVKGLQETIEKLETGQLTIPEKERVKLLIQSKKYYESLTVYNDLLKKNITPDINLTQSLNQQQQSGDSSLVTIKSMVIAGKFLQVSLSWEPPFFVNEKFKVRMVGADVSPSDEYFSWLANDLYLLDSNSYPFVYQGYASAGLQRVWVEDNNGQVLFTQFVDIPMETNRSGDACIPFDPPSPGCIKSLAVNLR